LGAGEGQGELIVGLSLQFHEQISLSIIIHHYNQHFFTLQDKKEEKRRKRV
jgi:hypothetical protein